MSLDFDCIIMNPPYDGNTHLKILNNVVEEFPDAEIVNLSPIRWLTDPLAEHKKNSDYKKFPNVRDHISSLEIMNGAKMSSEFDAAFFADLAIYHLTKDGGYKRKENKLLDKMISRLDDNLKNHIVKDDLDGISLLITLYAAGSGDRLKDVYNTNFNLSKDRAYYTNKKNETTGETYFEYKQRVAWGNNGVKSEGPNVKFTTREERENFYESWNTKTLRYMFGSTMSGLGVHAQFLPWLGDYTKKWDDESLREYFELTDEEWKEIENTVK